MINTLLLGLLLGFRHALEADHVLAVASLSTGKNPISNLRLGMAWGLGHTLTLLLVGTAVLFLDLSLNRNLTLGLEFAVGLMLIVLGADLLRKILRYRPHLHPHKHEDGVNHVHLHTHVSGASHDQGSSDHLHLKDVPVRALLVGMMHGMAGSSVLIILALKTTQSPLHGILHILLFGVGSMVGMALISLAIAVPMKASRERFARLYNGVSFGIAATTLFFGVYIVYDVGLVDGLLTH